MQQHIFFKLEFKSEEQTLCCKNKHKVTFKPTSKRGRRMAPFIHEGTRDMLYQTYCHYVANLV